MYGTRNATFLKLVVLQHDIMDLNVIVLSINIFYIFYFPQNVRILRIVNVCARNSCRAN